MMKDPAPGAPLPPSSRGPQRIAWAATLVLCAGVAWSRMYPESFADDAWIGAAWLAMTVRMVQLQLGLFFVYVAFRAASILRDGRLVLVCAIAAGICVTADLEGPSRSPATPSGPTIRVVSANVLMINRDGGAIADEIARARPDLLLVQEFTPYWERLLEPLRSAGLCHFAGVTREDSFGMAIYSRFGFSGPVDTAVRLGDWDLPQMRAVVDVRGTRLAVFQVHLLPPRKISYVEQHRVQVRDLAALLRREQLPVVLAGDFNFTGATAQSRALAAAGLQDAHTEAGAGFGLTWPVISALRYLPGLRLDHVFYSRTIAARSCTVGTGSGSDHRPLIVDLVIPAPPSR